MERRKAPTLPRWLARELPFERYLVDVGGAFMHVMEAGRGRPVVMLHGNPTWGYLWRKVVAALDLERFRVIVPDLIGLGLSDKPRDGAAHTLEAHIAWLGSLIDQRGIADAIVVGQDWGGPINFGAFAERRERAAGLVVLNTAVSPPRPNFKPTAFHRFARAPAVSEVVFRGLRMPPIGMQLAQGDRRSVGLRETLAYLWPLKALRDTVAPLALARMVPDDHDHPSIAPLGRVEAFLRAFEGPTAVVWGDRDPVLGRLRRWVEKVLPEATVTRTEAGHFLQEEVPEAIARAITDVADRADLDGR